MLWHNLGRLGLVIEVNHLCFFNTWLLLSQQSYLGGLFWPPNISLDGRFRSWRTSNPRPSSAVEISCKGDVWREFAPRNNPYSPRTHPLSGSFNPIVEPFAKLSLIQSLANHAKDRRSCDLQTLSGDRSNHDWFTQKSSKPWFLYAIEQFVYIIQFYVGDLNIISILTSEIELVNVHFVELFCLCCTLVHQFYEYNFFF